MVAGKVEKIGAITKLKIRVAEKREL